MKLVPSCILALCLSAVATSTHALAQDRPELTGRPLTLIPVDEAPLEKVNCESVATSVYESLSNDPSLVLPLIEDAINTHGECAPLVVATAIEATGAAKNPELLKQIVMLGVQLSAETATDIAQEAVLVAPDSADMIRGAFAEAFDAMEESADKPPVKEGPKSEWEERTNEAETAMVEDDAPLGPEPAPKEPAPMTEPVASTEAPTVPADFPKEAVLPEPKPLMPEAKTYPEAREPVEAPQMVVGNQTSDDTPRTAPIWAGEKSNESPAIAGETPTPPPAPVSNSPNANVVSNTPRNREPEPTVWQQDVTPDRAPVDLPEDRGGDIRELFGRGVQGQVGGLYFVPPASTATPTSAAVRRVSHEPRKSPTVQVITREENRRRPSFTASPVVRSVPMSPTTP